MFDFLTIGIFDVLDILLVAFIFFVVFRLVRGTVAANIFIGIFLLYLFWLLARSLNMGLTTTIIGQFMSVGVLALLILFQQEVRHFLLMLGSHYRWKYIFSPKELFLSMKMKEDISSAIRDACCNLSKNKTGALIVISKITQLDEYVNSGILIKSIISEELIENIFFKNTPLHDGAVIIDQEKIIAARCILPVSDRQDIPGYMGLRHRAALGLSALCDAAIIVVSEENGNISIFHKNNYRIGVDSETLKRFIDNDMSAINK